MSVGLYGIHPLFDTPAGFAQLFGLPCIPNSNNNHSNGNHKLLACYLGAQVSAPMPEVNIVKRKQSCMCLSVRASLA
jgi:hypothetical protein